MLNDAFGAAFTIADNGYRGLISVTLLDLSGRLVLSPPPMDSMVIATPFAEKVMNKW